MSAPGAAATPIVIDFTPAHEQGGGIGRYVRELVAALARLDAETPYRLFVAGARRSQLGPPPGPNFRWAPTRLTPAWLARIWHRARLPVPLETFTGRARLVHATDFVLPPALPGTRTLLTVHDLSFVRVPEAASPRLRAYLDAVVPRSVRRATHILADSEATRRDLVDVYGTPPEKITVLLSGVDARFAPVTDVAALARTRERYGLPDAPYLLSVGTVQPRKNYPRIVRALAALRGERHTLHLVIAGGKGWLDDELHRTIRETGMSAFVHLIGFAADEHLPALYSGAAALAFPSLYEGFGLPVLEAMTCGTPVLTSTVSSLPEVAGDAALTVDPGDQDAITAGLRRLLTDDDLRRNLTARGAQRAALFTWERAARLLMAVYTEHRSILS